MEDLASKLLKQVEYAKASNFSKQSLCEVHGKIKMAYELNAISTNDYLKLSQEWYCK